MVVTINSTLGISAPSNKVSHTIYASLPPAFFSKHRKIRLLGVIPGAKKAMKIAASTKKNVEPKFKLSDLSKQMGAPGWASPVKGKKLF